jgi:hypothetical protein
MTLPATHHIDDVYRGDDYSIPFAFFQDEAETVPQPLTASGWLAHVRASHDATTFEAFTIDTSRVAEGVLTLSLTGTQTTSITPKGVWDLQQTTAGKTRTWVRGEFRIDKDVSRA